MALRRNLWTGPSFEIELAGSAFPNATGDAVARTTDQAFSGTYSLEVTGDGSESFQGVYFEASEIGGYAELESVGQEVRIALRVRTTDAIEIAARVYSADGSGSWLANHPENYEIPESGEWTVVSWTQETHESAERVGLQVYSNTTAAFKFHIDGIQVQPVEDESLEYGDGSVGDWEWDGTEHASTSTLPDAEPEPAAGAANVLMMGVG